MARFGEVSAEVLPGTSYSYSNPGYNTLGALIEIASGRSLEVFLREEIYRPLGMVDSYNHEVAEKLEGKLSRACLWSTTSERTDGRCPAGSRGIRPSIPSYVLRAA